MYYSYTKLKYYIRPSDVQVLSDNNVIKFMLYKSILHNRIGKWALILIEFSLNFLPLKATKGQIVANFLADHTHVEILECFVGIKPWVLYFDGSKHIDGFGICIVIISSNNIPLRFLLKLDLYVQIMKHNMKH